VTSPYIIAEIGSNFIGSDELIFELIDAAVLSGAHCVKFQVFKGHSLYSRWWQENDRVVPSQRADSLIKYEFPVERIGELKEYCQGKGVDLLFTPFDIAAAKHLKEHGFRAVKIASGDLTFHRMLCYCAANFQKIFISTGAADLVAVREAINLVTDINPDVDICVMHCVIAYPANPEQLNVRSLKVLGEAFPSLSIGFSDHSETNHGAIMAVALGATVFEKHFTLNRKSDGPDHFYSMDPDQFRLYCEDISAAFSCVGSGQKMPHKSEVHEMTNARRGLYATRPLKKGEILDESAFTELRPCIGIPASEAQGTVGLIVQSDILEGSPLYRNQFSDK
jgi:N,N'-diacetyllegionaminate synthase